MHARAATSVTVGGQRRDLGAGEAAYLPADAAHVHGPGATWDVVLAPPDAPAPAGAEPEPVFTSGPLDGLPPGKARVSTYRVRLPEGAQTSVHTHPGPEFIVGTEGRFDYQNALVGTVDTKPGDVHPLPAGTPVQKRNPRGRPPAEFLSWFIVRTDQPFAPPATFGS